MSGSSSTRRTADEMVKSMSSIISPMLSFTTEIGEDFPEGKLPTLDWKIWISEGRIWYKFFEKPMSANMVIQAKSALSTQVKVAALTE